MKNKYLRNSYRHSGFTLIEMLVVIAIMSILLMISIPSTRGKVSKAYIYESIKLVKPYKDIIASYYSATASFPNNNIEAGMPAEDLIIGNYLSAVRMENGAMHLLLGNKISSYLQGKTLTIRPIFVTGSPQSPISWICGYDEIPNNMQSPAANQTDIERELLPRDCL